MVIDNADDLKLFYGKGKEKATGANEDDHKANLAQYIPECAHGTILVTTRDKQTGLKLTKGKRLIEVGKLGVDESERLLREQLEGVDELDSQDLSKLSSRLEYLLLALVQAASFTRENFISVSQYLELLDKSDHHFMELLSEEFETVGRNSQTPHAITSTWILSFEQVQRQDEFATSLLSMMSFFGRQAIPFEFLSIYNERYTDSEPKTEIQLTKALEVLKAFSFITEDKDHQFNIHRLIQLVTRK